MTVATPRNRILAAVDRAWLLLGISALAWAGNIVLGRGVHADIPPVALSVLRWSGALMILLPFTWRSIRPRLGVVRRNWRLFLLLGGTGMAGFHSFLYIALADTEALNAALLLSLTPVSIVAAAWLMLGQPVTLRQWLGIALSLAGVVTILTRGAPDRLLSLSFNTGDLWLLLAVPTWSVYGVLLVRKPAELPPLAFLTLIIGSAVLILLPFAAIEFAMGARMTLAPHTLGAVAYVAVCAGVIAYICWNRGTQLVGPARAGLAMHLVPIFAALLSVLLLGEPFRPFHLVGIAFIATGIALATRLPKAER
jgi:drug/metabolite transporter (DMT)-like permease